MTPDEKVRAIQSALNRVKNGESKRAIYEDFKSTEVAETVGFQLSSVPTLINRNRYKYLSWLLAAMFTSMVALKVLYFSTTSTESVTRTPYVRYAMYCGMTLLVLFFLSRYIKSGYKLSAAIGAINLYYTTQLYEQLVALHGQPFVSAYFGLLFANILLGLFLWRKLFPKTTFFGTKKNSTGDPVFED